MPSPSASLATLRPDLGESFEEFDLQANREGFIAYQVLPEFNTPVQSGTIGVQPIEERLKNANVDRAPGAGYNRMTRKFETVTYACKERGIEEVVDDREAKMYANFFNAEQATTETALSTLLVEAEKRVAAKIFNATTWTPTSVTNEWDDAVNATPIADVLTAMQAMYDISGLWANALIINRKVFQNLVNVAEIIDRIKYQGFVDVRPANITVQALAQALNIEQILVAGGTKNSANEGQAASPAQIWSDEYAQICRLVTGGNLREAGLGRTFHWAEDGSQIGGTIESYREESVRGEVIRVRHDVDEKLLLTAAAHLLDNITA